MGKIFLNLSNHPSKAWDERQLKAARQYGEIADMPFPAVDPAGDEEYIDKLAEQLVTEALQMEPAAVMCQGEFTLAYSIIGKLLDRGVTVLAACSERRVIENGNTKTAVFSFVRFREYRQTK